MKSSWIIALATLFSAVGGWMAPVWRGKDELAMAVFALPFLFLSALPVIWVSVKSWGWHRACKVWFALSLFAYAIEIVGVQTGFPYGRFTYLSGMGPFIGDVPIWLPLAWVPLILGVWQLVIAEIQEKKVRILATAAILILIDLVLDPGAVILRLWEYESIRQGANAQYYFVPWTNFAGWFLSGGIGAWLLTRLAVPRRGSLLTWLFPILTGLGFWMGVVARAGYLVPTLIGAGLLITLFIRANRDE